MSSYRNVVWQASDFDLPIDFASSPLQNYCLTIRLFWSR